MVTLTNFVHGGRGVGIHVRVWNNASCVTRQKTVVRCAGVRAAIQGQSALEVGGRSVVAMQYDGEQKLCENWSGVFGVSGFLG